MAHETQVTNHYEGCIPVEILPNCTWREKGIHYWEAYSPMVQWGTIILAIILALIYGWNSSQMDLSHYLTPKKNHNIST